MASNSVSERVIEGARSAAVVCAGTILFLADIGVALKVINGETGDPYEEPTEF